ncbi:hypothetical protein [Streptomyces buecherae]
MLADSSSPSSPLSQPTRHRPGPPNRPARSTDPIDLTVPEIVICSVPC